VWFINGEIASMTEAVEILAKVTLWRRFAVIVYDSILLFVVLYLAGALAFGAMYWVWNEEAALNLPQSPFYSLYLFAVMFVYFGWQWLHGGQTLGMKTWRVQIRPLSQPRLTWGQVLLRFLVAWLSFAAFGLGFLWSLWDAERRTWHDIASNSALVMLPKDFYD
jgi:uncharacterized RDD family membrane protein YckC